MNKKVFLVVCASILLGSHFSIFNSPLWAFDFESQRPEGYTLYFNIIDDEDENVVEVTYPVVAGNYHWQGHRQPWGELVIPAEVEHEGINYTVVSIGQRAFAGCSDITALNIAPTVTEIGAYAFYQCSGIEGTVTIGEEMVSIGRSAFYGCSKITSVEFNAIKCESMGGTRSSTAFGGCRSLKNVTFGPQVTRIPDYAFVGMDNLSFSWDLPEALEYVGEYAFAYCSDISGVLRLPAQVRHIGTYAFAQCHATTAIELPKRLERIDNRAFYQCVAVKEVNVKTLVPPTLGMEVFGGLKASVVYNVPCISIDQYKQSAQWKRFRNLRTTYPCKLDLVAEVNDPMAGTVTGAGSYDVGEKVPLTVICHAGYGFNGWSDGNTDNPRTVTVNDTVAYMALLQKAEVIREVKYIHDTTYMDGRDTLVEYYEINDVAEPIASQQDIVYNRDKRRIEVMVDKADLVEVALYNDAGQCVLTGLPKRGHINMRRFPTGAYIVRVTTIYEELVVRFFHSKKR